MTRRRPLSHARLIQAGREALLNAGVGILKNGLTIDAILKYAGVSNTTYTKYFPAKLKGVIGGKDKYIDELMANLVTQRARITQGDLTERIREAFIRAQGDPRSAIRDIARWDFEQIRSDGSTLIAAFIATFGRDHVGAMRSAKEEYDVITAYAREAYDETIRHWGASVRKPFTTNSLAVVLTALIEGLVVRWHLDPEAVPEELFGDAVVALIGSIIDAEHGHQHIDDVMAPLTERAMRRFELGNTQLPSDPRRAIIDAATEEFAQRGYFSTSLRHIAVTAGIEDATVKRIFPSKEEILTAALSPAYHHVTQQVATDTLIGLTPEDIIRRYLQHLAAAVIANRPMFDALMMLSFHDLTHTDASEASPRNALNFPALIEPAVRAGQEAGTIMAALPPYEVAAMLTNNILMRTFSRREHSSEEVASTVSMVLLSGILTNQK